MTLVKFCGLRSLEDVAAVNRVKPDFAGFILTRGFSRSLAPDAARRLRGQLEAGIAAVGVFVDEPLEAVLEASRACALDAVQLHGGEDAAYVRELKRRGVRTVIKRIAPGAIGEDYAGHPADYFLIDAGRGSGRTFPWGRARGFARPFFVAGGLTPDNVARAVSECAPDGVDASSGVETDGRKDYFKMAAFAANARKGTTS